MLSRLGEDKFGITSLSMAAEGVLPHGPPVPDPTRPGKGWQEGDFDGSGLTSCYYVKQTYVLPGAGGGVGGPRLPGGGGGRGARRGRRVDVQRPRGKKPSRG